jgi:hypothetical protein
MFIPSAQIVLADPPPARYPGAKGWFPMAIKLLDTSRRFQVISQYDESIDRTDAGNAAFSKYLETLDPKDLIKVEGKGEPTIFLVRCLTAEEQAEIQLKHLSIDPQNRTMDYKYGYNKYLLEHFDAACDGIVTDTGVQKVSSDDVGLMNAVSVGITVMLLTTLTKNTKNG